MQHTEGYGPSMLPQRNMTTTRIMDPLTEAHNEALAFLEAGALFDDGPKDSAARNQEPVLSFCSRDSEVFTKCTRHTVF